MPKKLQNITRICAGPKVFMLAMHGQVVFALSNTLEILCILCSVLCVFRRGAFDINWYSGFKYLKARFMFAVILRNFFCHWGKIISEGTRGGTRSRDDPHSQRRRAVPACAQQASEAKSARADATASLLHTNLF